MLLLLGCLCAFLLGGVPFALVVVRLCKGVDVRSIGSGNVGATNASRAFGSGAPRLLAFVAIYLLDAGKGFVAAFFGPGWVGAGDGGMLAPVLLGTSAILGHVFSPLLGFRGGKGVATATGVLLALDWRIALLSIGAFLVVRFCTGQVFLGSLVLGLALPVAAVLFHGGEAFASWLPGTVLCAALAAFLFWTHRSNLQKFFAKGASQ